MFESKRRTRTVVFAATVVLLGWALAPVARADFEQALDDFKRGKYVEAAAGFQEIVDQSPNYDYGYFMLGMSFVQMDKPGEAEEHFQKAIEINGDRFEYHHGLATSYFKRQKYSNAVATLRTAESLAADANTQHVLYKLRGFSYVGLEKWGDAIEDLEKARKISSSDAILDRLSLAYYSLGHYDKAVPVLRSALKSAPDNEGLLMRISKSLLNLGAESKDDASKDRYYEEALVNADKCLQLKPNDFDASNLVGRAALGAKNYARAEQAFRKVLAQKSDYCYAMANLGKVYIAQEKWADAESILRDGARCAPRMGVIYESLGFSLQKQGHLDEAIAAYNQAMQIKPSSSIQKMIDVCNENLRIRAENKAMDEEEKKNQAEIEAERKRQEEEEKKQKEWEERRKRDD